MNQTFVTACAYNTRQPYAALVCRLMVFTP